MNPRLKCLVQKDACVPFNLHFNLQLIDRSFDRPTSIWHSKSNFFPPIYLFTFAICLIWYLRLQCIFTHFLPISHLILFYLLFHWTYLLSFESFCMCQVPSSAYFLCGWKKEAEFNLRFVLWILIALNVNVNGIHLDMKRKR